MRRFPAEWEKQEATLLCFPHNGRDWPGKYGAIKWAFAEFIKKISARQAVYLVVKNTSFAGKVQELLEMADVNMKRVSFIEQRTNRSWMRDSGPIIVQEGKERVALNFNFNGWAKYSNHHLDKKVPDTVANFMKLPVRRAEYKGKPVILEGGAIDTNGKGTLLTSEECLLHPDIQVRNKGFSRDNYEEIFAEFLGIEKVIWLGNGIEGDDTHGHIDDLCRFITDDTVITVIEHDRKDKNFRPLQDNLKRLEKARLADGKQLSVIELPMPKKIIFDGLRLPASYANFLFINGAVLVPVFNDPNDRVALNILEEALPAREIIPVSAIDLIWGFGTLHCLSQQIPLCK